MTNHISFRKINENFEGKRRVNDGWMEDVLQQELRN
jgi:hypothetical protein